MDLKLLLFVALTVGVVSFVVGRTLRRRGSPRVVGLATRLVGAVSFLAGIYLLVVGVRETLQSPAGWSHYGPVLMGAVSIVLGTFALTKPRQSAAG